MFYFVSSPITFPSPPALGVMEVKGEGSNVMNGAESNCVLPGGRGDK